MGRSSQAAFPSAFCRRSHEELTHGRISEVIEKLKPRGEITILNYEIVAAEAVGAGRSGTVLLMAYIGGVHNFFGAVLGGMLGSCHALDLPFVFGTLDVSEIGAIEMVKPRKGALEPKQVADLAEKSVTRTAQILEAKLARLLEG